jgi:NAD(P)-dependent dehydrogenase (short-subunit alcohol dehydrogenase family)
MATTGQERDAKQLKPISEQVVVVFGASSGIGRETATQFAKRGAKVVVAARSEAGLLSLVESIRNLGGHATPVAADVTDFAQVKAVADRAWPNTAASTRGCIALCVACMPRSRKPHRKSSRA